MEATCCVSQACDTRVLMLLRRYSFASLSAFAPRVPLSPLFSLSLLWVCAFVLICVRVVLL